MPVVGVISDTHGLLRPDVFNALAGVDLIVHAGDIGRFDVIEKLKTIAPVRAVRGNVDQGPWANDLPVNDAFELSGTYFYVLHNVRELDLDPVAAGFDVVISGHSHQPKIEDKNGVLYVNPGSAGPRRFSLPISLARLQIAENTIDAELQTLDG